MFFSVLQFRLNFSSSWRSVYGAVIAACGRVGRRGGCRRKLLFVVACVPGLPWHSVAKAKLLFSAIQSRKLTPCSPFSIQGQSSPFWIMPSLLFLAHYFVGLNGAQHGSWPGQPLANTYKSYTCEEQLQGGLLCSSTGCFGSAWRRIGSKEWWLYLYTSFRCKQQLLYAKPSVQKALLLLMEPFSNHQTLFRCRCCFLFWREIYIYFLLIAYCCYQHLSPISAWNNSSGPFLSCATCVPNATEFPCNHGQCWLVALE